jgi:hypothetical protein
LGFGPENRTLVKSAAGGSDFCFGLGLRALPWPQFVAEIEHRCCETPLVNALGNRPKAACVFPAGPEAMSWLTAVRSAGCGSWGKRPEPKHKHSDGDKVKPAIKHQHQPDGYQVHIFRPSPAGAPALARTWGYAYNNCAPLSAGFGAGADHVRRLPLTADVGDHRHLKASAYSPRARHPLLL